MPLALMGFTPQSFPLEDSIVFSSNTITLRRQCLSSPAIAGSLQLNSCFTPPKKAVRPNKHNHYKMLIRLQVRSHPALVLPSTGGRYSHGSFSAFQRISPADPEKNHPLMCFRLSCKQNCLALQSIKNQLARISSEKEIQLLQALGPSCSTYLSA